MPRKNHTPDRLIIGDPASGDSRHGHVAGASGDDDVWIVWKDQHSRRQER
jgi:hypothetical protein